ncbi:hypothetical protein GCM10023201_26470 [Actinomycetospora corticicola]|uniref:Uncharacterized protein n=1 Tax=Actinomycetospora corticicola TaxID=663602 RepID=A0A7Y9DX99_9PSEU|nr:hypothetical protein [Actinomycetospora corticicola]NYD37219.1 hypothetical protein [Actinomycetospora corticicola]
MKVDSLLQREGRGPVERTGPIPLPGRRPRHLAGTARGRPVDPEAVTEPFRAVPTRPGAAFAVPSGAFPVPTPEGPDDGRGRAAVPRSREPRPTPATGIGIGPVLPRERDARPAPPRRPDDRPSPVRRVAAPEAPVSDTPPQRTDPTPGRAGRRGWRRRLGGRRRRTTVVLVLVLIAAALGAAGVAVAAWLASGSGSPALSGGTALAPTTTAVAGSAVTSGLLTPGATGTAALTVTNPNPYRVRVASIAAAGAATAAGGIGTCVTTGVGFVPQNPAGIVLVPAASTTLVLPGAVAMSTASETGCQGATFAVPVTVTVVSAP